MFPPLNLPPYPVRMPSNSVHRWYLSFWWTTLDATSEVTYTKIYSTTTFTTTATDEEQAFSEFAALSATLSFAVPASAQTSLAYYLTASPSAAATVAFPSNTGFTFNPAAFSSKGSGSVVVVTRTASASPMTMDTPSAATGTAAAASTAKSSAGAEARVGWAALVGALVVVPGALMAWL